jgi:hypothetical protein
MSIRVILPIVLFCAVMVETDARSVSTDSILFLQLDLLADNGTRGRVEL